MRVQNIQPNNFGARYITKSMSENIRKILTLMNASKTRTLDGDYFKVSVITALEHGNIVFKDQSRTTKDIPQEKIMGGFSTLEIGKSTLEIDNETGEIYDAQKPTFKPWAYLMHQAEEALDKLFRNFDNPKLVKKETLKINELTPEGAKKIKKMVLQVEKDRLEKIINKLETEV